MSEINENQIKEILDFAQMEPESATDIFEMIRECGQETQNKLAKIAGNISNAVRTIESARSLRQK